MRRRLLGIIGALALVSRFAAPVSAAAPIENGWDTFIGGSVFDQCTGEQVDNSGKVHTVLLADGSLHFNVHLVAIGESSGGAYVGDTTFNAPVHVAADGSVTADTILHVSLVSKGSSPDSLFTFRLHQVFAPDGTLISETSDSSNVCLGG